MSEPDEFPCFRCGEWFPPSDLVPYVRNKSNEPDEEGRIPVTDEFVYCPGCDREMQNELRDVMIAAGIDPDQNKERFMGDE